MIRKLTNEQLADLPALGWDNSLIDESKYYQSFTEAWEVDKTTFEHCKSQGVLCRWYQGAYYITESSSAFDYLEN